MCRCQRSYSGCPLLHATLGEGRNSLHFSLFHIRYGNRSDVGANVYARESLMLWDFLLSVLSSSSKAHRNCYTTFARGQLFSGSSLSPEMFYYNCWWNHSRIRIRGPTWIKLLLTLFFLSMCICGGFVYALVHCYASRTEGGGGSGKQAGTPYSRVIAIDFSS